MADDASTHAPAARYMPEDLHLRAFLVAGLLILASIAFALLAALGVMHLGNEGRAPPRIAARVAGAGKPPPIEGAVTLQPNPGQDIRAFDAEKRQLIGSYGWVDRSQGVARIPIERAMALIATDPKETKP
jgi:hypothetical protein